VSRIVRLSCPGVRPLQVWDLDVGSGQKFWEVVGARLTEDLSRKYSRTEAASIVASGIIRGCGVIQREHEFDTVFLAGGGAEMLGLQDMLRAPPVWMFAGRNYAWTAKEALFANKDLMVVVDVGQTSVKCYASPGASFVVARDFSTIPIEDVLGKQERSIWFIRDAVREASTMLPNVPLLLSLPFPIGDDLVPGESTYGVAGHKTFVDEVLADVPADTQVYVINDAELAAECARAHLPEGRKVLVLTLGLGPGAALIET